MCASFCQTRTVLEKMKKFRALTGALLLILTVLSLPSAAEQMRLTSDTLNYDPATGLISASGNVRVTGRGTEITSRNGEFESGGKRSHMWDEVFAKWPEKGVTLDCADLVIIEESGGQHMTARNVTRFHDAARKITMRGSLMEGDIRGGEFSDLVATGNVAADAVASGGEPTRVTGSRAVYSKAKDTMVFTGNAVAVQKNRKITAETFIVHIASGKIEAVGNPQMTVDLPAEDGK